MNDQTQWAMHDSIMSALETAERNGFRVARSPNDNMRIAIYTKGNNEHGFANDVVLAYLRNWDQVNAFLFGWEKREIAYRVNKSEIKK